MTVNTESSELSRTTVAEAEALEREFARLHIYPLWMYPDQLAEAPNARAVPHIWRYEEFIPKIKRLVELHADRGWAGKRRPFMLLNPGLPEQPFATTDTLSATIHVLQRGSIGVAHRHTYRAIRFIIEGKGTVSQTNSGDRLFVEKGDLLIDPAWEPHDQVHHDRPGDQDIYWMDATDGPMVINFGVFFFQNMPNELLKIKGEDISVRRYGNGLLRPAAEKHDRVGSTPVWKYRWEHTINALENLAEMDSGTPYDDIIVEYNNPMTGGPVHVTFSCLMQMLRPGCHTKAHRHVASAVYQVVQGKGATVMNGKKFSWKAGDYLALPAWTWHEHMNLGEEPALLFSISDQPVMEMLGYYKEQSFPENDGHQPIIESV